MTLSIITNASCFDDAILPPGKPRHLGTPDLNDPAVFYDYPGKAQGCLQAAEELQKLIAPQDFMPIIRSERTAEIAALLKAHSAEYLVALESASQQAQDRSLPNSPAFVHLGLEAAISAGTFSAALKAVGASYSAIDAAMLRPEDPAFALVWPPGHHAEREQAMGFCYLSNAALAALYARDHSVQLNPTRNNRVAVIDIDHHRGNGTASVLAGEPDTLFIDLLYRSPYDHNRKRYTDGVYNEALDRFSAGTKEYPYTHEDVEQHLTAHQITSAPNIVSLEFEGVQNPETILERFLTEALPKLRAFRPDVILWSVGLDSALGDPLGGLGNLPSSFYTMIRGVRIAFPAARHVGVLEGGYDKDRWSSCLKPTLLGFHDEANGPANRSSLFKRYRARFIENPT